MEITHPQLEAAIPILSNFVRNLSDIKRPAGPLLVYGRNGCGKTHITKSITRIFKQNRFKIGPYSTLTGNDGDRGPKIVEMRFVHWPYAVDGMKLDRWAIFEEIQNEYFVILDDIGAEHDPSGAGLEKLYLTLNRREKMHTLITTNFPPEQWEQKFERRIASRLFRNCQHVDLSDVPDYNCQPEPEMPEYRATHPDP